MRRKRIFCILVSLVAIAPVLCGFLNIEIHEELAGVAPEPMPSFSLRSFASGQFQKQFENYYASDFPNHNLYIKLYNQFRYSLLDQCIAGCEKGQDDTLFEGFYIEDAGLLSIDRKREEPYFSRYVALLEEINAKCRLLGKQFCFIITPSKAEFERDKWPSRYAYATPAYEQSNYEKLLPLLQASGVPFVNGFAEMQKIQEGFTAFPKSGTHWSLGAAQYGLKALWNTMETENSPTFEALGYLETEKPLYTVDRDIWAIQNIYTPIPETYYEPLTRSTGGVDAAFPRVFVQGGSFVYPMLELMTRDALVDELTFLFYDRTFYQWAYLAGDGAYTKDYRTTPAEEASEEMLSQYIGRSDWVILEANQENVYGVGPQENGEEVFAEKLNRMLDKLLAGGGLLEIQPAEKEPFANFLAEEDDTNSRWMGRSRGTVWIETEQLPEEGLSVELTIPWSAFRLQYGDIPVEKSIEVYINGQPAAAFSPTEANEVVLVPVYGDAGLAEQRIDIYTPYYFNPAYTSGSQDNRDRSIAVRLVGEAHDEM